MIIFYKHGQIHNAQYRFLNAQDPMEAEAEALYQAIQELIGHGAFGSVYLGRLSDGKLVAVKVRSDKTQLGADSFVNDVSYSNGLN
ncbi:LRR receptor-like serine/threonine-protein kinase [Carex littledalei]|uniref:LRR receptor-like serine/threonine-protein kinase n=1 Tax=Carex littledalei TaxID=544730 RepID=A0A833V6R8_9POAL|nr:LRR receptor-like serine/threonine-protein kinase [Carex littledalei]